MPETASGSSVAPGFRDEEVLELVRRHAPSFWRQREIPPATRLDDSGIGFDSVGLFELLVDCEQTFGLVLAPDELLENGMTVGRLTERLRLARPTAPR